MSAPCEERLRREIVATARRVWEAGWVANHDGNLSARLGDGRILATPTAVSKGDVALEALIVVDMDGKKLAGTRRPFSELALHLAAYRARPDIGVVIHAHPPTITGFSVAGVEIGHPFMAEPVVTLGPTLPVLPYRRPKSPDWVAGMDRALTSADAVVLERHGLLTVGGGFEQALLRMELVEHLAKIALVASQLGGVRPLPAEDVAALSAKGRPKSDPSFGAAPAVSPQPAGSPASGQSIQPNAARPDLQRVIGDALRRYR